MMGTFARRGSTEGHGAMARVFRGKIAMPRDHIKAYFQAFEQFEHEKKPLRKQPEPCAHGFAQPLARSYTPKTVRKHEQTPSMTMTRDFIELSQAPRLSPAPLPHWGEGSL